MRDEEIEVILEIAMETKKEIYDAMAILRESEARLDKLINRLEEI